MAYENRDMRARASDSAMQNLVEDVKMLSSDMRELLHQTTAQSSDQLSNLRRRAHDTLAGVEARIGPLQEALTERARYAARMSMQHVRAHPWSTLAGAAALALAVAAVFAWQNEAGNDGAPDDV
jgi:ElaB/YqjD/DUF883 family membrane-anchored ribosome-binding protein